jgi:malonyl CoA-acyl carrier protein transacylase
MTLAAVSEEKGTGDIVGDALLPSLRLVYPRGSAALQRTIAAAGDDVADVEIHADHLRLARSSGAVADVPFDAEHITPPGGAFDLLLDHDRETLLGVGGSTGTDGLLDALRPYYWVVQGARQPVSRPLLMLGVREVRQLLDDVLGRDDLAVVHPWIRAAATALDRRYDAGEADLVRNLRQACLHLRHAGLGEDVRRSLGAVVDRARRLHHGVRPVLVMRKVPREVVLTALGLRDAASLRRILTDHGTLDRLAPAYALDPAAIDAMSREQLLELVGELREHEFLTVFATGGDGDVFASDGLDELIHLVHDLSPVNAFLFSRERARRMNMAIPDYLPSTGVGRIAGFFPGLGSRAAFRDLDRSLLDSGIAEVSAVYAEAADALGFPGEPERLLLDRQSLPGDRMARQGLIGAAMVVHGVALEASLRQAAHRAAVPLTFTAFSGESFGIITAAVAAGALGVADGVRIANVFTPLLLTAAEGATGGDDFTRGVVELLPEAVRGRALVPQAYHVVALRAEPAQLHEVLDEIQAVLPAEDVELHKTYSRQQVNVYVRPGARAAFELFLRRFPDVRTEELKAPTTLLAHSRRMRPVREALEKFLRDEGITFRRPRTPIVSNNDTGLLTTAAEIRNAVLAITDEVMASRATADTLAALAPDAVVELGPGGKSLRLLADNHVGLPLAAFTGDPAERDEVLDALRLTGDLTAELEKLYLGGETLDEHHYDLLRGLLRLTVRSPLADRSLVRTVARIVTNEMLHPRRDGAPAFYRFLEVLQHTRQYRDAVDIDAGELVLHARLKKRFDGGPHSAGRAYAELTVLDAHGVPADRSIADVAQPEALVFHFDRLPELAFPALAARTRTLLTAQPFAREIYDRELERLGIEDDGFLTATAADPAPTADQVAAAYILYQYALFQVMRRHRPAIFAHDYYVEGNDPMGWLVALAASGTIAVTEAVRLYRTYLGAEPDAPELRAALDEAVTGFRAPQSPVISPDGVPLQSTKELEVATRVVLG